MKKLTYTHLIIALCFLMVLTTLGFCSSPRSLFVSPVTEALSIKRSQYAFNDSCRYIATALINIFFGSFIARFGSKKLICAGFFCLVLSMLTYASATNLFLFCFGGCLLGIGLSWTGTTMVGYVVNRWCRESKGTIMGFILASNGIGGSIAIQILSPIIYREHDPFSYRKAYLLVAGILFAVGLLILFLYKDTPKQALAASESPKAGKKKRGQNWTGLDYPTILRKPYFYGAAVCIFLTGFLLQGMNGVAAAHMKDVGIDAGFVASVLSIHSLFLAVFKFLTGFIYDKKGLRFTVTLCCIASLVSFSSLTFVSASSTGVFLALMYGVLSGLALPLETILLPIYASDLFGQRAFEQILGIVVSLNVAGFALGAPAINLVFDLTGSYVPGLAAGFVLMILVVVLLQFVINAAQKIKSELGE